MAKIGYKKDASDFDLIDATGSPYINQSRFDYAILENVDDIQFKPFDANTENANWENWEKGKLFGKKTELKWQKRNGRFHMVVTTEEELPAGFTLFSEKLETVKDEEGEITCRRIYLWGEQETNASGQFTGKWFEERIPQLLEYPIQTDKSRVKIKVQEYELSEEHEIMKSGKMEKGEFISIVHRFVGLEGV
ncbi:hypothetical protein KJ693_01305 [bacterium]|nr:hypothetical protein [bacterium]MBU1613927.1 hypothetical protein [bacterium]